MPGRKARVLFAAKPHKGPKPGPSGHGYQILLRCCESRNSRPRKAPMIRFIVARGLKTQGSGDGGLMVPPLRAKSRVLGYGSASGVQLAN